MLHRVILALAKLAFSKSSTNIDPALQKLVYKHILILLQDGIRQSQDDALFTLLLDYVASLPSSERNVAIDENISKLCLQLRLTSQDDSTTPQWTLLINFVLFLLYQGHIELEEVAQRVLTLISEQDLSVANLISCVIDVLEISISFRSFACLIVEEVGSSIDLQTSKMLSEVILNRHKHYLI